MQEISSAPAGARPPSASIRAPSASRRSRSALAASRACSRTTWPGPHVRAHRHLARVGVGADEAAHEEVALDVLGLVRVDDDAHQQPALDEPEIVDGQRLDRLAQLLERRAARQLADDRPLAGGDRQLRPDRRGALRDAGQDLDAVEAHADGAGGHDLLAEQERRLGVRRAGRGETAEQRQHRRGGRELAQHRVGREGERIGQQQRARGAGQVRQPAEHALALAERLDLGVEGHRLAAVERRGPDRDRRALLDLAHLADHARGAAADELRGRERLVDALERRLRRREVRARGEHDREVAVAAAQRVACRGRGLGGAEARVRLRREAAADAYAHRD